MKKLLLLCFCMTLSILMYAEDSIKVKRPQFITINNTEGMVFATNDFVSGDNKIPHYSSYAIKYGFSSRGDNWKDFAYGLPYGGIGVYVANFYRKSDLGIPISVYFFQGAQLFQFNKSLTLNYEWNLGASFNWKHYDPFDNPENIAVGSAVNIHVAGNVYFNWRLSRYFDLHLGGGFNHFSNGASTLPNKGLNLLSAFVELSYHFNRDPEVPAFNSNYTPPAFHKRVDHDLMFLISSRQAKVDTLGTGLSSPYTNRKFKILGVSYAYMFSNSYRYKWGPSVEATYDESSGIKAWGEYHAESGRMIDRFKLGAFHKRLSLGFSVKGEISMPAYSMFAHLGWDVIHGNQADKRFYQILGVKVYLKDNLFGTFGIRANNFGKAQYLYWNLGYTFSGKGRK